MQVYKAVKASVLGAAFVNPSSSLVTPEVTEEPQGSLQIVRDYSHLPIVAVRISSAAVLERLRADSNVLSVEPDLIARTANTKAFGLVGQPMVTASGYWGIGNTAVTIDTGMVQGLSVSLGSLCKVGRRKLSCSACPCYMEAERRRAWTGLSWCTTAHLRIHSNGTSG